MAFTYGFYNSLNHDRKYNAEQISAIIDGLIKGGVFYSIGEILGTIPGTGMQVIVKPGRAWFDRTWSDNDSAMPLNLEPSDVTLTRYDAVVLEVDASDAVRKNSLKILTGVPATNPAKPAMTNSLTLHQHPLAYVKILGGVTAVKPTDIQIVVGTNECPFVTGILESANIDVLFAQWESEFNAWFDDLKEQLSDDVVANLQKQINELKESAYKTFTGTTVPASSLGSDGDTYVKIR